MTKAAWFSKSSSGGEAVSRWLGTFHAGLLVVVFGAAAFLVRLVERLGRRDAQATARPERGRDSES